MSEVENAERALQSLSDAMCELLSEYGFTAIGGGELPYIRIHPTEDALYISFTTDTSAYAKARRSPR